MTDRNIPSKQKGLTFNEAFDRAQKAALEWHPMGVHHSAMIREIRNGYAYGYAAALLAESSVETSAERNLGNILAVIHADGGQYQAQHGDDKATEDAIAKYYAYPSTDKDAFSQFAEYIAREMPEGTVIGDPAWWAPRLWRFARYAFEQGQGDAYKPECAPAKATRAQTGQLSPAVQSPSETTALQAFAAELRSRINGMRATLDQFGHDGNYVGGPLLDGVEEYMDELLAVKATEQSSAPANQLALEPVPPAPGSVAGADSRCEKHGVELAFPGDECWACEQENKP